MKKAICDCDMRHIQRQSLSRAGRTSNKQAAKIWGHRRARLECRSPMAMHCGAARRKTSPSHGNCTSDSVGNVLIRMPTGLNDVTLPACHQRGDALMRLRRQSEPLVALDLPARQPDCLAQQPQLPGKPRTGLAQQQMKTQADTLPPGQPGILGSGNQTSGMLAIQFSFPPASALQDTFSTPCGRGTA
ncbi:hypothetical protein GALL_375860 [mine drainage metagenome]|uniref:Uncharacterized protein n=1 Tax=mine drainage metagenome TaxID=410659 RepID=A0A1J5QXP3_9ZZZZ